MDLCSRLAQGRDDGQFLKIFRQMPSEMSHEWVRSFEDGPIGQINMPTTPARMQDVFLAASQIQSPADRATFLNDACDGDTELQSRIEALLRAHDQPDSMLDQPVIAALDLGEAGICEIDLDVERSPDAAASLQFLDPPTRPDSLGRISHYEMLQVLGRGGFGIVFRAFDDVLHRVVAVKVLLPTLALSAPARMRFLREARSSAQVRHENVVQVYEVGEQPLPHIAMEFIPGETLQQRLDRSGPLDVAEVIRIGRQIAEGLVAAHATGLIHRDIKPGNVLLEDGLVKITDFGLARAIDDASLSHSGLIAGTPMYMSPEQAKGELVDQRADLFSVGTVLYEMVVGQPPFRASGTLAVLKRVIEDSPQQIREIISETPQWLCDIIAKLHAKRPEDRFQSARELAVVLAECETQLRSSEILNDSSSAPSKMAEPARRLRRTWNSRLATMFTLGVGVSALVLMGPRLVNSSQPPFFNSLVNLFCDQELREQKVIHASPRVSHPVVLWKFAPARDKPVPPPGADQNSVTIEEDTWRIENAENIGNFNVLLGTILDDIPADGLIVFRAKVKVEAKNKLTWGDLQLGVGSPAFHGYEWPAHLGEYRGDVPEWTQKELRYPASVFRQRNPPSIPVYVGLHADGVLWIKDAELLYIPPDSKQ